MLCSLHVRMSMFCVNRWLPSCARDGRILARAIEGSCIHLIARAHPTVNCNAYAHTTHAPTHPPRARSYSNTLSQWHLDTIWARHKHPWFCLDTLSDDTDTPLHLLIQTRTHQHCASTHQHGLYLCCLGGASCCGDPACHRRRNGPVQWPIGCQRTRDVCDRRRSSG